MEEGAAAGAECGTGSAVVALLHWLQHVGEEGAGTRVVGVTGAVVGVEVAGRDGEAGVPTGLLAFHIRKEVEHVFPKDALHRIAAAVG